VLELLRSFVFLVVVTGGHVMLILLN